MDDTNISIMGKILAVTAAAGKEADRQSPEVRESFFDMMAQTGKKQADGVAAGTSNKMPSSVPKQETAQNHPTEDYRTYRYKDNKVASKENKTTATDTAALEEKMAEYAEAVKDILKEELGVSEEAIEQAMQVLGLQYADLLNQNNLANLVAALTGTENIGQLLCNEQFLNVMQRVGALGEELLQNLSVSIEELQQMSAQQTEAAETVAEPEDAMPQEVAEEEAIVAPETKPEQTTAMQRKETVAIEETTEPEALPEDVTAVELQPETEEAGQEMMDGGQEEQEAAEQPVTAKEEKPDVSVLFKDRSVPQTAGAEAVVPHQNTMMEQLGSTETIQPLPEAVTVQDIIEQIVDSTRATITNEVSKIQMQLNPENLGKVLVEITEQEGVVSAKLQTQTLVVKEALEVQLADLRQNLNQAGIRVDEVEVTVASHEFEQNLEQDARGEQQQAEQREKALKTRSIRLNGLDELAGLMSEEEALVARMMAEQGNSVDYTA